MLEVEVPPTPEGESPGKGSAPEVDFHEPGRDRAPLSASVPPPKVKRFRTATVATIAAVAAVVMIFAFSTLARKEETKPPVEAATVKAPAPNSAVSNLKDDYSNGVGSRKTTLPPPSAGDFGPGMVMGPDGKPIAGGPYGAVGAGGAQLTPIQQYWQQKELDRLKAADQARASSVGFTGGGDGGAVRTSGVAAATAPGVDAVSAEERLLAAARGSAGTATGASTAARDDDNRQDDKAAFADKERSTEFDLHHGVQYPRSPYTMFAGTIVPCIMTTGIDSDLPGQIGCMVSQNVYDTVTGQHLLLPQGTKAIGTYDSRISYGQDRVLVVWTRLLRPDGSNIALEGMPGTDLSGYAGLTGKVNNHYVRLLSGVVLGSIIGAGAQVAAGANNQNPGFGQLAVQGAGQNINQAGQQITRKNLNIQPTIQVAPGSRLNIFSTKDIVLPPYKL